MHYFVVFLEVFETEYVLILLPDAVELHLLRQDVREIQRLESGLIIWQIICRETQRPLTLHLDLLDLRIAKHNSFVEVLEFRFLFGVVATDRIIFY